MLIPWRVSSWAMGNDHIGEILVDPQMWGFPLKIESHLHVGRDMENHSVVEEDWKLQ